MEQWANVIIGLGTFIATYAVMRFRVSRLEVDLEKHQTDNKQEITALRDENKKLHDKLDYRVDAGFKKLDTIIDRTTILERDTSTHLTMPRAEEKFVSKQELELHLKNIEITIIHTNKMVDKMSGKLEDVLSALSIKTRTIKED